MKFYSLLLFAIYISAAASAQKKDTLFYESFNNNGLDRTKWNVEVTGRTVNNEQQAYVDSASVLMQQNGLLVIKPTFHAGYVSDQQKHYDFISGRINTRGKYEFTYGTLSARLKTTAGAGLWPAFWALGEGKWPDCGEIDIMETVGDSSWVSHALHGPGYFGNTPLTHRSYFPAGIDVTQWHVYSVTWSASKIVFSVDGAVTYIVTRDIVEKYGRYAFDNPKFIILNFAVGGGYPHGQNKVDAPYFGVSQTTVDKIKTGQAKMLVDWVLVTK